MTAVLPSSHPHFLFLLFTAYLLLSVARKMPSVSVTMETTGDRGNYVGPGTCWKPWCSRGGLFACVRLSVSGKV